MKYRRIDEPDGSISAATILPTIDQLSIERMDNIISIEKSSVEVESSIIDSDSYFSGPTRVPGSH